MEIKELEKQFSDLQGQVGLLKKDFEIKLANANKDIEEWKSIAHKSEEKAKAFAEEAKKAKEAEMKAFAEARAVENKAFLENLKKEGRISPVMQEYAEKLMTSMASSETVATFETKDGKKEMHTQFSLFKLFLSSIQKSNVFKQLTPKGGDNSEVPDNKNEDEKEFTEVWQGGEKKKVPMDDTDLHMNALEYIEDQKKNGKVVGYADALIEVSKRSRQGA